MSNVQKQLQDLFKEWENRMIEESFCRDGIHYRHPDTDEQIKYDKWNKSEIRILFIAKEPPPDATNDLARAWSKSNFSVEIYARSQYLYITFILNNKPEFKDILITEDKIKDVFEKTPFCWINIKKSRGKATAVGKKIAEHLEVYGDLLLKQIEILNPTDIICLCGANNWGLKEKLKSLSFQHHIYKAFHPAYRRSREKKYTSLTPL